MSNHHLTDAERPVYPEITKEQWAVLQAMTPQGCVNIMEARDFIADLTPEAKEWLRAATKEKIENLNQMTTSYANARVISRFLVVSAIILGTVFGGIFGFMKTFGEYFTVKFK